MRCEEFEKLITEFTNVNQPTTFQLHLAQCTQCAGRLAHEFALNAGLKALAATTAQATAAPQIKQSLMTAFAEQHQPTRTAIPFGLMGMRWSLTAGMAAILLTLAAVGTFWNRKIPLNTANNRVPEIKAPMTQLPTIIQAENQADKGARTLNQKSTKKPLITKPRSRPQLPRKGKSEAGENKLAQETKTEFFPLTYAANAKALQNGMLMRVEVPKTTLIAMGIQVNERHANELVKAEVMMGDDGVAYGIRLIQER